MPTPDLAHCHPYSISVADEIIQGIRDRVRNFPWHEMPADGGWEYGTNLPYLQALCDYWVNDYEWQTHEDELNRFDQFITNVDDIDLHFILEKGSGESPTPLLISHGWPGSVAEFKDIIEPLAHPERFGGNVNDAFDVIAPSLPGFAYSGKPNRPMGPRAMASMFNKLMTDTLGYDSYVAQGGDWGGAISSWLGFEHVVCKAIHINILTMRHPDGPQGEAEQRWAQRFDQEQIMEEGYRTQQATRPQTLSYAMMDRPVGIAAWLVEKFNSWSDVQDNDIESVYSRDELLTNIMIYVTTRCFNTASWIYYGRREEGGRILSEQGHRVEVPTACAVFPEEMLAWPPRSYVDRLYNVAQWTTMPRGGHFAAMEQPELLVDDIRQFARSLRTN